MDVGNGNLNICLVVFWEGGRKRKINSCLWVGGGGGGGGLSKVFKMVC